eukprot:GHVR01181278.1.p1 GENE.GHVR01181278.1~~GHVR01181278.1.p1  ORF type:complete len:198 (-),score=62.17 GHVR01181278.1:1-594(-)
MAAPSQKEKAAPPQKEKAVPPQKEKVEPPQKEVAAMNEFASTHSASLADDNSALTKSQTRKCRRIQKKANKERKLKKERKLQLEKGGDKVMAQPTQTHTHTLVRNNSDVPSDGLDASMPNEDTVCSTNRAPLELFNPKTGKPVIFLSGNAASQQQDGKSRRTIEDVEPTVAPAHGSKAQTHTHTHIYIYVYICLWLT